MQQILRNGTSVEWNGLDGRGVLLLKSAKALGLKLTIVGSRIRHRESGSIVQEVVGPGGETFVLSPTLEYNYLQEVFLVDKKRELYSDCWQNEIGFFVHPRYLTFLEERPYEDGLDNWV